MTDAAKPTNGDGKITPEDMIGVLAKISIQMEANARMTGELLQKMDDLIGHFEVIDLTMELLGEMKDKPKLDIKDFARCWREAADEIFGEGEEEDEPDSGDPLVDIPSRR